MPLALTLEDIPGGQVIIEVAVIVIAFTFTTVCLFFNVWYRIPFTFSTFYYYLLYFPTHPTLYYPYFDRMKGIFVPLDNNSLSVSPNRADGRGSSSTRSHTSPGHSRATHSSYSQKSSSGSREEVTSRAEESASVV